MASDVHEGRARSGRFPFASLPSGWFAIAFSDDVPRGSVRPLRYFDRELALWRGHDGIARLVSAHCPHLGAHLGHGTVRGDALHCPFHGWAFDGTGRCVAFATGDPDAPLRAATPSFADRTRVQCWSVVEDAGLVFAWHHPDGAPPTWQLPPLPTEGWSADDRIVWRNVATHPQEVLENTVDPSHFPVVHGARSPSVGRPSIDGHVMSVPIRFQHAAKLVGRDDEVVEVHLDARMHGLGQLIAWTDVPEHGISTRQRMYCTPIDRERIDIRAVLNVRETGDPAFLASVAEIVGRLYREDFERDMHMWEHKRYHVRPRLGPLDGPIMAYRRWAAQFYGDGSPRATTVAPTRLLVRVRDLVDRVRDRFEPRPPRPRQRRVAGERRAAPVRRVATVREYVTTLPERFVTAAAHGLDATFQWDLHGPGATAFHAIVRDSALQVHEGHHDAPDVTLVMAADDFLALANREIDGPRLFLGGRARIRGDVSLALRMRALFPG